jgi:hypothetical protein
VKIIRKFFTKLPGFVDHDTREAAEAQLAELACGLGPDQLRKAAERLAMILDQDGDLSDADRAKRSYFIKSRQRADGMSEFRGSADPELAALLDAVFAKWAAPGCATPPTKPPVWTANPAPKRSEKTYARPGSATTTPSKPSAEPCWRPDNSAATRDCR